MTVGERILTHRKRLGISQEALGRELLVSRQTVSLWEKNQTFPTIDNLVRLKEIFGISLDEIICGEPQKKMKTNSNSLNTVAAALAYAIGIAPPTAAAEKNAELSTYVDRVFDGEGADRIVIYNPDAIAQWIYEKYPDFFLPAKKYDCKEIFLASVMPSITPSALATMYTGVDPQIHGIKKYEKPILTMQTLFDALVAAGKRVAIVSYKKCSLGKLFLGRDIDYYNFEDGGVDEVNAKATELILKDEHDFIAIYNGNYDYVMHRNGPESPRALAELLANSRAFSVLNALIKENWRSHNTLIGFATDHGCHEIEGGCGSHGLDMVEDINIVHLYKGYPRVSD